MIGTKRIIITGPHASGKDHLIDCFFNRGLVKNISIMTPDSISKINSKDRKACVVVYIQIPESVRRSRIMSGGNGVDDTSRRINADKEMFKGFIDYDYRIKTPNFNPDTWVSLLGKASNIIL